MIKNTVHNLEVFFNAKAELTASEMLHFGTAAANNLIEMKAGRAVTEVFFFGGRRGSGKTYAAGKLVEQLLGAGFPVIVIDVVGNWWGLRVGAEDPDHGFRIPVIGGDHGDIAVFAEGGATVAKMLVDTGSSAVLDLSQLRKGARQRFLTDWAEEFFHLKKSDLSPVHVVIEEAHTVIPQRVMKGQERMLGALEDLVRLGRNYGIGVSMLDQRPQSVHKDVLNQAEVLCAFQFTGAQERDAIRRWAEAKELDAVASAFRDLASLPRGQCILWSPEWLKFCGKVDVAPKITFDASATPDAKDRKPKLALPIDLPALEAAMAKAAAVGKRSDESRAVKTRVERDRQNAELDARVDDAHAYERVAKEAAAARAENATLRHRLSVLEGDLAIVRDKWARALSEVNKAKTAHEALLTILQIGELQVLGSTETIHAPGSFANGARAVAKGWAGGGGEGTVLAAVPTDVLLPFVEREDNGSTQKIPVAASRLYNSDLAQYLGGPGESTLSKMARMFLTALAIHGPLTQQKVLIWSGYARSGDTDRTFAFLRSAQYVSVGNFGSGSSNELAINGNGAKALGTLESLPPVKMHDRERTFLAIVDQFGPVSQKMVLLRAGYARSGDTDSAFARLRKNGWVTEDGNTRALTITDFGKQVVGEYWRFPVGEQFYEALVEGRHGKLTTIERHLLRTAWVAGVGMTQKDLLAAAERKRSGDTDQAFSHLVSMGLFKKTSDGCLTTADFLRD